MSYLLAPPCPTSDTMNCFCVKTRPHQPLELIIFTPVTHKSVIVSEVGHSGRGNAEAWHQEVCGARARQRSARQRGTPPRRAPSLPAYFCEPASSACTK